MCFFPDNQWRQYHATMLVDGMFTGEDWSTTFTPERKRRNDSPTLGTVMAARWGIKFADMQYNSFPADDPGIDMYLDYVKFSQYSRDRSWVDGANERIKELRTMPVQLNVINAPVGATVDIEQLNGTFPWGSKFSNLENDNTYVDQNGATATIRKVSSKYKISRRVCPKLVYNIRA